MLKDRYGMPLTTVSTAAVDCYVRAMDRFLEVRQGVDALAREAIGHDERFAMAWLLLGLDQRNRGDMAAMAESMARVEALSDGLSDRETSVLATFAGLGTGSAEQAEAALRAHLARWPGDALIMQQAAFLFGILDSRPDRVDRHLRIYEDIHAAYGDDWYFNGQWAFACEEKGDFARAEDLARRSVAANPQNGAAAHSFVHVLLETGRAAEAARWLETWRAQWRDPDPAFAGHLLWHQALSELASGDAAAAAAKLDAIIDSPLFSALTDGASLAWRLHLDGIATPGVAERLVALPDLGPFPFSVLHKGMAYALAGEAAELERLADSIALPGHEATGRDAATMLRALSAMASGDPQTAAARLDSITESFKNFGGSLAQYEVLDDTLIAALAAAGRGADASARLSKRLERRASPRDRAWAQSLEAA